MCRLSCVPADINRALHSIGALALGLALVLGAGPSPSNVSAAPSVQNAPQVSLLQTPPGFQVNLFASDLGAARFMAFGPAGELYLTSPDRGAVTRLRDLNGDGAADEALTFLDGLNRPHGITTRDGWVYVAETNRVVRALDADLDGQADRQEIVVPDLPSGGGHFTRTIEFGPDGRLYVSIGSSCNVCIEEDSRRAALMVFEADGSNGRLFAQGLRNSVGFVFHSESGEIWATDNGRDRLGDDYPPEEINIVREGSHYGWPMCHGDREPDPELGDAGFCAGTEPPAFSMQAHSAPLGLGFVTGNSFPPDYQGDLLVAFHGSWNRSIPTGYKVVRIQVENGQPTAIDDFLWGFTVDDQRAWGRPVQPLMGPDGALYVSDDAARAIYRVTSG